MSESISCTQCGRQYRWKKELAGNRVKCKCGASFEMPRSAAPATGELELDEPVKPASPRTAPPAQLAQRPRDSGAPPRAVPPSGASILDEVIEARQSSYVPTMLIAFGVVVALIFPIMLIVGTVKEPAVGWVMLLGGLTAIIGGVFWMKFRPVRIALDRDGLDLVLYDIGPIPWTEIEEVEYIDTGTWAGSQRPMCICLNVSPAYRKQLPKSSFLSVLSQLQRRIRDFDGRDFDIVIQGQDFSGIPRDLVDAIQRRVEAVKK